jgi:hypothetical protein
MGFFYDFGIACMILICAVLFIALCAYINFTYEKIVGYKRGKWAEERVAELEKERDELKAKIATLESRVGYR